MTKTLLTIVFRSPEPVDKGLGDYEYIYTALKKVPAEVRTKVFRHSDGDTIDMKSNLNFVFSIILANDKTDRVNNISHVEYLGRLYKVDNTEVYSPRVVINLAGIEAMKLSELLGG